MSSGETRTDCVESAQPYERWVDERTTENTPISRIDLIRNSIDSNLETLRSQKSRLGRVCCLETNSGNPEAQRKDIKKIQKITYKILAKIHEGDSSDELLQKFQHVEQEMRAMIERNEQLLAQLEAMTPSPNPASIVPLTILIDPYESAKIKKELREKIAREPGLYDPLCLYMVGLEYLKAKEFDKAAKFCVAGSFRQEIEMRINGRKMSSPAENSATTKIFQGKFEARINSPDAEYRFSGPIDSRFIGFENFPHLELLNELKERSPLEIFRKIIAQLSSNELALWSSAWETAEQNFEAWDRATPRYYNIPPPNNASFEDKKRAVIERFYREIKGTLTEEDLKNASAQDRNFFDPKTRTFYLRKSQLSFKLPEIFRPTLNRLGKFEKMFILPKQATFRVSTTADHSSFQEAFDDAVEDLEEDDTLEKGTLNNGTRFYRMRHADSVSVINDFGLVKGSYTFIFKLNCYLADEQNFLEQVDVLLNSIS